MLGCFQEGAGLTAVSLFSGAGGLDVGFERAGFEVVFANESDRDAAAAWRANRPEIAGVMAEGDILDHMGGLRAFEGGVDVVFGGPPCQGFSIAGKMDPDDPRSARSRTPQPRTGSRDTIAGCSTGRRPRRRRRSRRSSAG